MDKYREWLYLAITVGTVIFSLGIMSGDVSRNTEHRKKESIHVPSEKIKAIEKQQDKMAEQINDIHKYLLEKK